MCKISVVLATEEVLVWNKSLVLVLIDMLISFSFGSLFSSLLVLVLVYTHCHLKTYLYTFTNRVQVFLGGI